ncbi:hypothetical protein BS47DRAFT_1481755 [Hydnum rufescens UP504]|uniref:Uncharacterized protein n=1 Tax=Hydnum rufescens UP504 TaxID=1448309 RepID=A0A9P6B971_9AGAM|nr:hypothetical protein BS47DRAFT_1481755 [Hydnum rufescens UP504]
MASQFSFDPSEAKAQAEYERSRQRRAAQRGQQHQTARPTQLISPPVSPSRGSWRKPSLSSNNRDRRKSQRVSGGARDWFSEDPPMDDDDSNNEAHNVPEATWDSASETEQSGADDALLSDYVAHKTDPRDFINVSEYYLARGAPGYHYSPEHQVPQPDAPLMQERVLGPGLGLPIDAYRWVLSEEENGCTMSWPSPQGHSHRTAISPLPSGLVPAHPQLPSIVSACGHILIFPPTITTTVAVIGIASLQKFGILSTYMSHSHQHDLSLRGQTLYYSTPSIYD